MKNIEWAKAKAEEIVFRMTAEERISQLRYDAPAIERLGIRAYNWWNEACHGVARAGVATVFPQAIGMAATFHPALVKEVADAISTEGRAKYNQSVAFGDRDIFKGLTYWAPNINIFRDPRWGRGQKTCGEDPFLTSEIATAYIVGCRATAGFIKPQPVPSILPRIPVLSACAISLTRRQAKRIWKKPTFPLFARRWKRASRA